MKAPSTAVSASARWKKKSRGRSSSLNAATSVQATQPIAVSAIMNRLSPFDAQRVVDAELRDPVVVRDVLEAAAGLEVDQDDDHVGEHRQRARQNRPASGPTRHQRAAEAGRERQEEDYRQVDRHELFSRK